MIKRRALLAVREALDRQAAVALIGPRQVGKTTLAHEIADEDEAVYLDLELPSDRAKLNDPELFFAQYTDKLVILDEIHRMPALFDTLRGVIDQGRRKGQRTGRFLILGSAALDLLRQSESLAGRIAYIDMGPFDVSEAVKAEKDLVRLWVRGGFPDAFLAKTDAVSLRLRQDFIRTYLERDVPQFGPRIPAEALGRLWVMLAHGQGTLLNASKLATNLSLSAQTVTRYIDLLADLLLVRRLPPLHANVGKRLVKSPKVYVRDSGLLHALLEIGDYNELAGHPVVGSSWEGFVIENILALAPERTEASFYRTAAGAEIDLVLDMPKRGRWAIEIKRNPAAKLEKGFHMAREDLKPDKCFVVHSGSGRYPVAEGIDALSLIELTRELER